MEKLEDPTILNPWILQLFHFHFLFLHQILNPNTACLLYCVNYCRITDSFLSHVLQSDKGIPTIAGKPKSESKDKERKHKKHKDKDREKDKEHKKHRHRHKAKSKDKEKEKKKDKSGHHDSGAEHTKKHHEKVSL